MALLVYMTAASADEAERIAGDLVESRLAACLEHGKGATPGDAIIVRQHAMQWTVE